jgi:hypothetical protein
MSSEEPQTRTIVVRGWLTPLQAGTVLENPITGERYEIIETRPGWDSWKVSTRPGERLSGGSTSWEA